MGGALGNVIDRVTRGYVVDFVDFYVGSWHFAAFNVADAAITCGAALLILDMLIDTVRSRRSEEHTSELQSLMRISYAVFCLKKKIATITMQINKPSIIGQQNIFHNVSDH